MELSGSQGAFVEIQMQDETGNWRTYHLTQNIPALIRVNIDNLKRSYPDSRIRAVDDAGRVLDIT